MPLDDQGGGTDFFKTKRSLPDPEVMRKLTALAVVLNVNDHRFSCGMRGGDALLALLAYARAAAEQNPEGFDILDLPPANAPC